MITVDKFDRGEHLTDGEIEAIEDTFLAAFLATRPFGERYIFVCNDAIHKVAQIKGSLCAGLAYETEPFH